MIIMVMMVMLVMMMEMAVVHATVIPKPSLAPSMIPSTSPSSMPIISATSIPTQMPVIQATIIPSSGYPSFMPISTSPTVMSSRLFNTPTMNPSLQPYPVLSFRSDFTFNNITVDTLDGDNKAQRSVIDTTASTMNITDSCVTYVQSTSSSSSSYYSSVSSFIDELYEDLMTDDTTLEFQHTSSILIEEIDTSSSSSLTSTHTNTDHNKTIIVTTLTRVEVIQTTSQSLYTSLTDKLTKSVESGRYTKMLHKNARSNKVFVLYHVNVSKVVNFGEHGRDMLM